MPCLIADRFILLLRNAFPFLAFAVAVIANFSHEGLRRVAPAFGAASAPAPSRCKVQRRASVQAIAEPRRKSTPRTFEECEADVVAGNAPASPPVPAKAKAPEGTPRVSPLVRVHRCIAL